MLRSSKCSRGFPEWNRFRHAENLKERILKVLVYPSAPHAVDNLPSIVGAMVAALGHVTIAINALAFSADPLK